MMGAMLLLAAFVIVFAVVASNAVESGNAENAMHVFRVLTASLVPSIVALALGGGWLISWGALRPLKKIMKMTSRIADANDLSMRLNIHKGPKEVRRLARNFDSMLDRLEKSFEEEKQFTSDASHELRTPVAVILAECERAKKRERTAEDYKESLGYIEDRAKRMKRIVAELLNITRLSLKADKYPLLEADLSSYVSDCIYEFVPADTRGITLETDIEEDLSVNCNLFLISGLVGNLVQNAYKYGKEGGHVWVSLKRVRNRYRTRGSGESVQQVLPCRPLKKRYRGHRAWPLDS